MTPPSSWAISAPAEAEPEDRLSITLKDLEERFAGRALAWVGGIALVAAAVFFLSLAFSRGWITEEMRVIVGLAAGIVAFTCGAVMLARRSPLLGNVLAGVGLGIISIAIMAATRIYGLVPPEVGLLGALVAASAAAAIAVRFDARSVAAYGLIAALGAPPIVGASPTVLTLLFIATALIATTSISLFRSWRWLPSLAFVLAAPQLAGWLTGNPDLAQALIALTGFWAVNIVAAAGEEVRIRRDDLRTSSTTLVLANLVFLLWGLFTLLDGDLASWRGVAVGLGSLAHLLVGGWFLLRQGLGHLFGNLVAGSGVALLALAAFVQLGAPAVPVAWAAESVALAWLAVRRRHGLSAAGSLVLGGLAIAHLVALEYPLRRAGIPAQLTFEPPFLHGEAGSLAAVLLALGVAAALIPVRWIRSALAGIGVTLAAYAMTFELTGPPLAAALVVVSLVGLLLDRLVARLPVTDTLEPVASATSFGWFASSASILAGTMAVVLLFSTEFPPSTVGIQVAEPFLNPACLSLAIVLAGLAAAGGLVPVGWLRSALGGLAILLVAWALWFQVTGVVLIAWLVVLLPAGVILDRGLARLRDAPAFAALSRQTAFRLSGSTAGAGAWCTGFVYACLTVLNPFDWGSIAPPDIPFSDQHALAAALLAGAALAAARWLEPIEARRTAVLAAVAPAFLVVPFEVHADLVVVLWVALGGTALLAVRWDRVGRGWYAGVAALLWLAAALVAFGVVARPDRVWVAESVVARPPLPDLWPLAFVALAVSAALAPRVPAFARWRAWLELAAGTIAVYAVSVAVVDVFARRVGGTIATEELAKQAQVALSVCWTVIGVAALIVGLATRRARPRHAGLALLALATAKVFMIDLASMDVAYRALVLAGLGTLLLASAYLFTRFRGRRSDPSGLGGGAGPAG